VRRGLALIAVTALLGAGCGEDDEEDGGAGEKRESAGAPRATNGSPMECLTLSTLSPELIESRSDADPEIRPLLTKGARGAAILTGRYAAIVIEYPDAAAAQDGLERAREPGAFGELGEPRRVTGVERVLFVDFTGEQHVRRVVEGCATKPNEPPPT
jgi:hypothetical protein